MTICFRGQFKSRSGYGNHARSLAYALLHYSEKHGHDLYLQNVSWGGTPDNAFRKETLSEDETKLLRILDTKQLPPNKRPDIYFQIGLPNEFEPIGSLLNVGITAGAETNVVSLQWIESLINKPLDYLIVPSKFNKDVFYSTQYEIRQFQGGPVVNRIQLQTLPIEVLFEGVDTTLYNNAPKKPSKYLDSIDTPFNFLFVGHWLKGGYSNDRKNVGKLIKCFLEAFRGNDEVSLILKTSHGSPSIADLEDLKQKILSIRKNFKLPESETPKIHLIHGELTDEEMAELHSDERIKAFLYPTHGESWGIPLINSMVADCPTLATGWSGHLDFSNIQFEPSLIRYSLREIPADIVWENVLIQGSKYAEIDELDFITKMQMLYSNYQTHKDQAIKHGMTVRNRFSQSRMEDVMIQMMEKYLKMKKIDLSAVAPVVSDKERLMKQYGLVEK